MQYWKKNKVEEMSHFKNTWMQTGLIAKKIGQEMKNNLKSPFEKKLQKRPIMNASATSIFLGCRSLQKG
jgi:hypothetical protein